MRYRDLEIRIGPDPGGGYRAEVIRSLYGGGTAPFLPPFPLASIAGRLAAFEAQVRGSGARRAAAVDPAAVDAPAVEPAAAVDSAAVAAATTHAATVASAPGGAADLDHAARDIKLARAPAASSGLEEIGRSLYESLFAGEVGLRLRESLAYLQGQGKGERLRLRLMFDPHERSLAPIAALPWELLRDPANRDFLSLRLETPVVRYLPVARPPLEPFSGPLRVLVVDSAPSDLAPLDLAGEWRRIWSALERRPAIEVARVERPALDKLRERMAAVNPHVLHFMGHGHFAPESGVGCLYLEDPDHRSRPVTGMLLGSYLTSAPALRLAVLNACGTGAVPRRDGQDPYSGVAAALVLAGVPAVLAMQFPISDGAAVVFSGKFYERLAVDDPVEAALVEARLAILSHASESLEWATPVLFTRDAGEELIGQPSAGDPAGDTSAAAARPLAGTVAAAAAPDRPSALRLGIRSIVDADGVIVWDADMESECEEVLDLRPWFGGTGGREILDASDWRREVVPRLHRFLAMAARSRRPLHLYFAAHASIAFTAGYLLEAKSGLDVTIRQRGQLGAGDWRAADPTQMAEPLFRADPDLVLDGRAADVALAVGISHQVIDDVRAYLSRTGLALRRVVLATPAGGSGEAAVRDALHALQLAQGLAWKIEARTSEEKGGVLHLFASAPNALLFFLGQLAPNFGKLQLYEHAFRSGVPGAYSPSIALPGSGAQEWEPSR